MHELQVILVDDNDVDIIVNTKLLALAGVTESIVPCTSGEEFLTHLRLNPETVQPGNTAVLMDIQMPDMDGFEVLDRFVNEQSELAEGCHIFLLSSSMDSGDVRRAEDIPYIIKVLEKPLDVRSLSHYLIAEEAT